MTQDIKSCLIGDRGVAKSTLAPSGIVEIEGAVFSARAQGTAIDNGVEIVVASADIGGLVVRCFSEEIALESLPRFGEPAYDSFGDRANAVAAAEAKERLEAFQAWQHTARKRQLQFGVCLGIAAVWLLHPLSVTAEYSNAMQIMVSVGQFIAAFVWAVVVFRVIDHCIRKFDEEFISLITFSTCLSLICSAFGLSMMPSWGITMGLGQCFVGAIFGAAIIPFFATFLLSGGE